MIINDKNRFIYIHIPKCAGTSIRGPLSQFDDRRGLYTSRVEQHASLGLLDYVHLPLFTLRDYFNSEYRNLEDYWSFTVIRDPFERFPSSLSQQLKMYGERPIQSLDKREIRSEIERAIHYLSQQPKCNHQLPAEYIHFQKQVDFVYLDGKKKIDSIYTVDQVSELLKHVGDRTESDLIGGSASDAPKNQTVIHRNELVRLLYESTRPINRGIAKTLPANLKSSLRSWIFIPRDQRLNNLFSSDYVRDFVHDYYKDDLDLWKKVISNR